MEIQKRELSPDEWESEHPRILIIEDNRDAADSMGILLERLGYDVRIAYSGLQGVHMAERWRPSVVLSDIGLPELDGYEVARELRRNRSTADTRLIAITAYGAEEDRRHAHQAGFNHFMTKPADFDALRALLPVT